MALPKIRVDPTEEDSFSGFADLMLDPDSEYHLAEERLNAFESQSFEAVTSLPVVSTDLAQDDMSIRLWS